MCHLNGYPAVGVAGHERPNRGQQRRTTRDEEHVEAAQGIKGIKSSVHLFHFLLSRDG
jgi:hypothetical protein